MLSTKEKLRLVSDVWSTKLNMSSLELSKLVPVCELYSITDSVEKKFIKIKDNEDLNDSIHITIKYSDDEKSENKQQKYISPLFSLLRTQTQNIEGELINKRGVPGINNISVKYHDAQFSSLAVTMSITVPDLKNEIKINPILRKFIAVNSDWLIFYGWSKDGVSSFSLKNEDELDLTRVNGYNKFLVVTLGNLNFESGANGETTILANFYAKQMLEFFSRDTKSINNELTKLLNDDTIISKSQTNNNKLPKHTFKNINRTITEKKGNSRVQKKVETLKYYYLGWILEAIKFNINGQTEKSGKTIIGDIIYETITNRSINTRTDEDLKVDPLTIQINNLSELLVDVSVIEKYLYTNTGNFKTFIINILKEISKSFHINLALKFENDKIIIYESNDIAIDFSNDVASHFNINYGAENSLLETLQFESSYDFNVFVRNNVLLTSSNGNTVVYNVAKELADDPKSYLGKLYKSVFKDSFSTDSVEAKKSFIEKISSKEIDIGKIYGEVFNSNNISVGYLIRNFINTITFTIHGTTDIIATSVLNLSNYLDGIDGIYHVLNFSDDVTPKSFHTVLECTLGNPNITD